MTAMVALSPVPRPRVETSMAMAMATAMAKHMKGTESEHEDYDSYPSFIEDGSLCLSFND